MCWGLVASGDAAIYGRLSSRMQSVREDLLNQYRSLQSPMLSTIDHRTDLFHEAFPAMGFQGNSACEHK